MSLKETRKRENYTLEELSLVTDINPKILGFYESGYRDINGAKLGTLLTICEALSCDLEDILTGDVLQMWQMYRLEREGDNYG